MPTFRMIIHTGAGLKPEHPSIPLTGNPGLHAGATDGNEAPNGTARCEIQVPDRQGIGGFPRSLCRRIPAEVHRMIQGTLEPRVTALPGATTPGMVCAFNNRGFPSPRSARAPGVPPRETQIGCGPAAFAATSGIGGKAGPARKLHVARGALGFSFPSLPVASGIPAPPDQTRCSAGPVRAPHGDPARPIEPDLSSVFRRP